MFCLPTRTSELGGLGKSVLIVEDDALLRMDAVYLFEDAGYRVLVAANADTAMQILASTPDITLLFTDIEMPGSMDGLALAFAVRNRWPPILIVIASGRVKPTPNQMPAKSAFLPKPYNAGQIETALRGI